MTEPPTAPPPTTDPPSLATRYGLVRPVQGRYLAGVGAALGRATRSDPVLWRVVLAVLVCFAGLGVLVYLLVWLLTPAEGDSAAPLESLLGRGYSSTSPVVTGLLGLVVVGLLSVILPRPFYLMLAAGLTLVVVLLINRAQTEPAATSPPSGAATSPAPAPPPAPPPAAAPSPAAATEDWPGGARLPGAVPVVTTGHPGLAGDAGMPGMPGTGVGAGYRQPFAPHGPFAGPSGPPTPLPRPPRPPRERSRLPAAALFTAVLALGVLGGIDLLGLAPVPAAGYVAAALTVLGTGLLVGAWVGRARLLIGFGVALVMALPVVHAVDLWERPEYFADEFFWAPESRAEVNDDYDLMFGSGVLDLRQMDLSTQDLAVAVEVSFGEVRIIVPPDVALVAELETRFAGAMVLGEPIEGVTSDTLRFPAQGEAQGHSLQLDLTVQFGHIEVTR